jgi:hypothetical protein
MRTGRVVVMMVVGLLLAGGCAEEGDDSLDDAEAEETDGVSLDKADAEDFAGLYRWSYDDRPYWANDIPSIEIRPAHYVRSRCYKRDCALLVPQSGALELVRTSAGKKYLRFMSYKRTWLEENGEWLETPALADTYEIKKTRTGIKLRKTRSSRWFSLRESTLEDICLASGGEPGEDPTPCTCEELAGGDWSHYMGFFPGLGGCFEIFAANEDTCSSTGSYTDDDATSIGTYCRCPLGTYETQEGCVDI